MASTKNKKGALLFLLVSIFLGVTLFGMSGFAEPVFAQEAGRAADVAAVQNSDNVQEADNVVITAIKYLLYWLLLILVGFVQVAASVFAWATRPEFISGPTGLLNLESVYELWKFIRDFFNLFFIFLLLFSAFATVFQVEQYGLKKNFFKIVFAAIAINFSFPITRIIIDLGNVPMYFFADGIVSGGASKENNLVTIPMAFFQTTGIAEILTLPSPSKTGTLPALLSGVIFTFIFMITLFTLALLFVLRLLKLIILLIFSPLGIATSIVPGLQKFGKQWWSSLIQTVFFGPAAMLMVVVALRFTAEIQKSEFATGLSASAPAANAASQSSIITQGIFFIPIILMWMAMHVGNRFGIEGSSAVIKKADAVAAWGKKQALFRKGSVTRWAASPVTNRAGGAYKGLKKRTYEGRLFGDKVKGITGGRLGGKAWKEGGENAEARWKGAFDKGSKGVELEMRKADNRRLSAKMKEFKDDLLERSDLEGKLLDVKADATDRRAAALLLAESKEGITKNPEALRTAMQLFKDDPDRYDKIRTSTDDDVWDMSHDQFIEANEIGVGVNLRKEGHLKNKDMQALLANGRTLQDNLTTARQKLNDVEAQAKQLAATRGITEQEALKNVVSGLSGAEQALYNLGKSDKKTVNDFGKQIKKTGGNINYLFEYQRGKKLAQFTESDFDELYKQHGFTMKDISQQSAILREPVFQQYAINTWKPGQVSELVKAMGNNKDQGANDAVEIISKGVSNKSNPGQAGGTNQQNQGQQQSGGTNQQSTAQQRQQRQNDRNTRAQQARTNQNRPVRNP